MIVNRVFVNSFSYHFYQILLDKKNAINKNNEVYGITKNHRKSMG